MGEIKKFKKLIKITLINGREIISSVEYERLKKAMEVGKMLDIEGILVNTGSISTVESFDPDEVDSFIEGVTDRMVRCRLRGIKIERQQKGLKLGSVQHLMDIYTSRFGVLSDDNFSDGEILS